MWDYDSILGKAETYFERGAGHPSFHDEEMALWFLLGFEFLLRAPLARIHPTLLAAPDGDALLHANGFPTDKDPKSVPTHTVRQRLRHLVNGYTADRDKDAEFLVNLRNAELHTGQAALADVPETVWLPRFIRVVDVICGHLGLEPETLITDDIDTYARALADEQDARLKHEIEVRITAARAYFEGLTQEEIIIRTPVLRVVDDMGRWKRVACPACAAEIRISMSCLRTGAGQLEGEDIAVHSVWVVDHLHCPVCALDLEGASEIAAAGLEQQYVRTTYESLADRYSVADDYVDYEYGND